MKRTNSGKKTKASKKKEEESKTNPRGKEEGGKVGGDDDENKGGGKRIISVFYAPESPNEEGELNYHRFEEIPKGKDIDVAKFVGGSLEILPHRKGWDAPFVGYADEEGLLKRLRRNDLAGGALEQLGFRTHQLPLGCAYAGTVVVLGKGDRGLTLKKQKIIEDAISAYRALWDADGNESSASEEEKKEKEKKSKKKVVEREDSEAEDTISDG